MRLACCDGPEAVRPQPEELGAYVFGGAGRVWPGASGLTKKQRPNGDLELLRDIFFECPPFPRFVAI